LIRACAHLSEEYDHDPWLHASRRARILHTPIDYCVDRVKASPAVGTFAALSFRADTTAAAFHLWRLHAGYRRGPWKL